MKDASKHPLQEMFTELLNGVEYIKLGDIENNGLIKLGRGNVISKQDMKECPGDFPVYSSSSVGDGEIGRYGKYMFDDERISWSIDGGGKFFYRNNIKYSITNVSGWLKVLTPELVSAKYLYYSLTNEWVKKVYDYTHKAHPSVIREEYVIPVPPLPVQEEIVRILDNFTNLAAELQAELQARQQQYQYYRDTLLSFEGRTDVEWKKLGEVEKSHCSGSTPTKSKKEYYDKGTIPWLRTSDVKFNEITEIDSFITELAVKETSVKWIPENCVIVAISGATAGRCAINKIKTTTNQHCLNIEIDDKKVLYKYVFYCLCNQYDELVSLKQGARGDLNSSSILNVKIPIPPLAEQQRIVDILDRFDTLVNDLSQGLPAEIEARQQQYEYYRDRLLRFKRM